VLVWTSTVVDARSGRERVGRTWDGRLQMIAQRYVVWVAKRRGAGCGLASLLPSSCGRHHVAICRHHVAVIMWP